MYKFQHNQRSYRIRCDAKWYKATFVQNSADTKVKHSLMKKTQIIAVFIENWNIYKIKFIIKW